MEMSQVNSLSSCLKETKMSFTKLENKWVELVLPRGRELLVPVGEGEGVRKECRRVNTIKILCTHVCKWKNDTC
jgi:hypothetical protein